MGAITDVLWAFGWLCRGFHVQMTAVVLKVRLLCPRSPKTSTFPPTADFFFGARQCFVVGRHPDTPLTPDDDEVQMNSRTFCHMGPVCFDRVEYNNIHDFSGGAMDCSVVGADTGRIYAEDTEVLKTAIGCQNLVSAHIGPLYGRWTIEANTSWIQMNRKQIVWHPMGVVVPKYDYQFNICHVNRMMAFAAHAVWNAEVYNMTKPASVHVRGEGVSTSFVLPRTASQTASLMRPCKLLR